MSPTETTAASSVITTHLRELPNTALEAAIDLVSQSGPAALIELISDEFCRRQPFIQRDTP
ncbi:MULTISPECIES: hypothetical protein [unclassified Synechococcus]|uniref:hypothetical protein n=1 Tax=unclassified Synechococcus TaxID=2626047 RepID=UPI0008FF47AA|nr:MULTISPECIES: hypothetical protein [unclassified Synechococcus]APD47062.1 hypothetical protein BM449_00405 [Synechococcus sp. SynAce01]TWB89054.1 hypothetical protein FB106_11462 [Synechococcus sp. Ace-Pa]